MVRGVTVRFPKWPHSEDWGVEDNFEPVQNKIRRAVVTYIIYNDTKYCLFRCITYFRKNERL